MKKPYASDWKVITEDLEYSPEKKLYWKPSEEKYRDEYSANWAGWIGAGALLREIIKS